MANNIAEVLIGAAVIGVAAGFIVYAGRTGGLDVTGNSYPLTADFRTADGIAVGTDVRVAGIKVGSVSKLALDPQSYKAQAIFTVQKSLAVPEDSDIKISSEGLLGGSFLEITPGASDVMLASGDPILNTQGSVNLLNLLMRFGTGK